MYEVIIKKKDDQFYNFGMVKTMVYYRQCLIWVNIFFFIGRIKKKNTVLASAA